MTRIIVSRLWSSLLVFCGLLTLSLVGVAQEKQLSAEDRKSLNEVLELNRKVIELHNANRVVEAFPLAKRVLSVRLTMLGENDPSVEVTGVIQINFIQQ
jgi:hypothetical protein